MGISRISKNESRLDSINENLDKLNNELQEFKSNKKECELLNEYYGSSGWFKDKDDYEKCRIPKVKAGVLSEDAVWNTNEKIDDIIKEMQVIVEDYLKTKEKDCHQKLNNLFANKR